MVMDPEETEARNNCAGEGQQQFNPVTYLQLEDFWGSVVVSCCYKKLVSEAEDSSRSRGRGTSVVGSRYQATAVKM
jgi:hypothetical protein